MVTGVAPVAARFAGLGGPDSASIDADDNVYVACFGPGKFMDFNLLGNLIGRMLIPGREAGSTMSTTAMAIVPGTNDLVIGAGDFAGRGACIFEAKTFEKFWDGACQFQKSTTCHPEPSRAQRATERGKCGTRPLRRGARQGEPGCRARV